MVTITGMFDQEKQELVTIKMNRTDYKLLAALLKAMDLWFNMNNNDTYRYIELQYDLTYIYLIIHHNIEPQL